jgi:acetylornithine deacetylase/succinyl-diaminopimelate desuccinylase-like protein
LTTGIRVWGLIFLIAGILTAQAHTDPKPKQLIQYNRKAYSIEQVLSKYLQFESISGKEREAGEFLMQLCEENGLFVTQMGATDGNYNFTASIRPLEQSKPNIIFLNHLDVVPAGDVSLWTEPPFSGKITDTEIWGRGAFDNKGTAIMHLFSLIEIARRYEGRNINYNVSMLSVSCEETQCDGGIEYVLDNYFELLNPALVLGEGPPAIKGLIENKPDQALFGISVAQKRALWLELQLHIKTNGHSSVTPLTYANKEMVEALNKLMNKKNQIDYNEVTLQMLKELGKLSGGFKGFILKHPRLFKSVISKKLKEDPLLQALYSNTITITNIQDNNDKLNSIPTQISATLDCRLLPQTTTEEFLSELKSTLDNDAISIEILTEIKNTSISSSETVFYRNLSKAIAGQYPDSKIAPVLLPNSNDVASFRARDVLAYSVVPVSIERSYLESIHNINERIPRGILEKGKNTFVNFIEHCITVEYLRESVETVSTLQASEPTSIGLKI